MSKYKIAWTVETWYSIECSANSEAEALDLFWQVIEDPNLQPKVEGQEMQDSIVIREVK